MMAAGNFSVPDAVFVVKDVDFSVEANQAPRHQASWTQSFVQLLAHRSRCKKVHGNKKVMNVLVMMNGKREAHLKRNL